MPRAPLASTASRRIAAGAAHDAAARMAAGAAEIQTADRHRVLRRARDRPQHQELVERELAVMPVTARDAELALDVRRQQQLRCDHLGRRSRRVALEDAERALEKLGARRIGARARVERRVLHDRREHVLAGGRQRLVVHASES